MTLLTGTSLRPIRAERGRSMQDVVCDTVGIRPAVARRSLDAGGWSASTQREQKPMPTIKKIGRGDGYLLVALTVMVASCGVPEGGTGDVTLRDSAGVAIVDNRAPEWTEAEGWIVDSVPEVVIGAAGPNGDRDLLYVRDIVRMTNGDLVVANVGVSELDVFDSTGRFLRSIGRAGRGPGEFDWMLGMLRCGGDTLVVNQGYFVSVFDPDGAFIEARVSSKPPGGANRVFGATRDCGAVLMVDGQAYEYSPPSPGNISFRPARIFWSELATNGWDTVTTVQGPDLLSISALGAVRGIVLPYGSSSVWTNHGDRVFVADTDRPEIRILERRRGLHRVVRWQVRPTAIASSDRVEYDAWRKEHFSSHPEVPRDVLPPSTALRWPDVKPLFAELQADDEGNLWVRPFPPSPSGMLSSYHPGPESPPEEWTVIDSTGRWLGAVQIPGGVEVKAIQARRILGIARDADDVEEVRVYRIIRE